MKKVVVRNKIMELGSVNSNYILKYGDKEYKNIESFINNNDYKTAIEAIYNEEIDCEFLENSFLYKSYVSAVKTQASNDYFKILYLVDVDFAIELTDNIYLYHLIQKKDEVYSLLIPWYYADSKKYLGDTWWEEDEEILENVNKLSMIDFLKKYKGY